MFWTFLWKVMAFVQATTESCADCFTSLLRNFMPIGVLRRKSVEGNVVLITGAGNGLGRLTAIQFSLLDSRLVLWDIDEEGLAETKKLCEEASCEVHNYVVNMADRTKIYQVAESVKKEVGQVDILINNAGLLRDGGDFLNKNDDIIEKTVEVNMMAHMWMAKAFLPHMIDTNNGHIVSICSLSGIVGAVDLVDYSASKFGANGFQEALENEMWARGKKGIKFTTVCPAYIKTRMINHIPLKKSAERLDADTVVFEIMDAILTEKRILILPKEAYLLYAIKGLVPRRTFQRFLLWKLDL